MYSKNMRVAMTGFNGVEDPLPSRARFKSTPSDNNVNVRDILSSLILDGSKSMGEGNVRARYAGLSSLLGISKARKLIDHALIYNQTGNFRMSEDERLRGFYDTTPADPDIRQILAETRSFGDGVIAGASRSPYVHKETEPIASSNTAAVTALINSRRTK